MWVWRKDIIKRHIAFYNQQPHFSEWILKLNTDLYLETLYIPELCILQNFVTTPSVRQPPSSPPPRQFLTAEIPWFSARLKIFMFSVFCNLILCFA